MNSTSIEQRPIPLIARADLEVSRLLFRGEVYHVVKDPLALTYHHLQSAQYEVWSNLDGSRSPEQIRQFLLLQFPTLAIRVSDIQQLVTDLHAKGLTTSTRTGQFERLNRRQRKKTREKLFRAISSPLFVRFPSINPTIFVAIASPVIKWIFHPLGASIALSIICASWVEAVLKWDMLKLSLPSLDVFFGWPNLLWLWGIIGGTKFIHEMGHAVACQHVGRRCHGIGAALLVFSPTLYCDATDSWMCINKWDRILVALAGMYIELIIGAIALFTWSHTHAGTLQSVALNIAAVSTVSTVIFNANPLIRFDGYYVLSDLIEIPNLQEKSSRLLYRFLAWCFGISTQANAFDPKTGRFWFVVYAICSLCYRWFIMSAILWTIYAMVRPYRIESLGGLWVGVVMGMASLGIYRSAKNVMKTKKVGYSSRRRLIITLTLLSAVSAFYFWIPVPLRQTVTIELSPKNPTLVYTATGGTICEIKSVSGHTIRKGDEILQLANSEIDDEIHDLRVNLKILTSEGDFLELGNKHSELIVKRKQLLRIEQRLNELSPLQDSLRIKSPATGLLYDGPYVPPVTQLDVPIKKWSRWLLQTKQIGAYVAPGTLVARVATSSECEAILYIDQDALEDINIGQTVMMRLDALPHEVFHGKITTIAASKSDSVPAIVSQRFGGRVATKPLRDGAEAVENAIYRIAVSFPADARILPGMRGRAKVPLGKRTLFSWTVRMLRSTFYFRI